MPGRKPKPTHLKIVAGNPGRRALNKNEPRPAGNLETPPHWLAEAQQKGWRYIIEHSPRGLLKRLDSALLVIWVIAEDTHRQAAESLAESSSLLAEGSMGQPIASPYIAIMNNQAQIMIKAAGDLGFTPVARTRITVNTDVGVNKFALLSDEN